MTTKTVVKDLAYYMALPYSTYLKPDEDGTWFAEVPELPGCMTYAHSRDEVLVMLEDAKETWLEGSLHYGDPIPEPKQED